MKQVFGVIQIEVTDIGKVRKVYHQNATPEVEGMGKLGITKDIFDATRFGGQLRTQDMEGAFGKYTSEIMNRGEDYNKLTPIAEEILFAAFGSDWAQLTATVIKIQMVNVSIDGWDNIQFGEGYERKFAVQKFNDDVTVVVPLPF